MVVVYGERRYVVTKIGHKLCSNMSQFTTSLTCAQVVFAAHKITQNQVKNTQKKVCRQPLNSLLPFILLVVLSGNMAVIFKSMSNVNNRNLSQLSLTFHDL